MFISKKKLISNLINLMIGIFISIYISKLIFIFISDNTARLVIIAIVALINFWLYNQFKNENSRSIGKFLADKLIKKDKGISIIKLIILFVILDIIASILDYIINCYL